jgi:serine/threonine protein kinase
MELVEGETLADRIAGGPIPLDEALPTAKQIAEALEAAHERHHPPRFETCEHQSAAGTVKVLDFGLAKALVPVSTRVDATRPALNHPNIAHIYGLESAASLRSRAKLVSSSERNCLNTICARA